MLVAVDAAAVERAQMGGVARRRPVSASLWRIAALRGAVGAAAAARQRSPPRLSGARAVIGLLGSLARPMLRMLDPEDAHRLIHALRFPPFVKLTADDPRLAVRAFGLNFPNPVGGGGVRQARRGARRVAQARIRLRRGRHRDAGAPGRQSAAATVPAQSRPGRDQSAGIQQRGADAVLRRLAARASRGGIVGVNIGANKESTDRISDYVRLIETFAPVVSYFSVNISSPNTPGLRELQRAKVLDSLLARVMDARAHEQASRHDPGADQDRARPHARRARRHRRRGAPAPRRRHDRRQYHGGAAGGITRPCSRTGGGWAVGPPLVCPRDACWRRPMCGWKAPSLSSASAGSIPAKQRLGRSGRGRA